MKRKVSKRPKIGSHGFKVYKGTYVNVGQGVNPKLALLVQDLWNNNESTKKMRKHVRGITIKKLSTVKRGGRWNGEKGWYEHIQKYDGFNEEWHKSVFYHEIEGHAFWDFAKKWRREALIKFNEMANNMPALDEYAKENEVEWKKINDDLDKIKSIKKKYDDYYNLHGDDGDYAKYQEFEDMLNEARNDSGHKTMTRYANEQHSILTEIIRGVHTRERYVDDVALQPLVKAWEELHS